MCRVVTIVLALLSALAAPAVAMPLSPGGRAEAFATCIGTYTAEAAHRRLSDGAEAEAAAARQAAFRALAEAVAPHLATASGPAPSEIDLRARTVQARMAQRARLSDAAFHPDAGRRARAADAAAESRAACDRLLLGA
ncbi:hypothetical protein [Rhodovulum sp. 12E13]|uniref:hypothetical protein n=1 Tax=Rhodovulum sp. 12E13 TaxID=2203891 RepID=UPI0011C04DB8|nr:hypothetical protein [Rhodovulum sp. 12E13]